MTAAKGGGGGVRVSVWGACETRLISRFRFYRRRFTSAAARWNLLRDNLCLLPLPGTTTTAATSSAANIAVVTTLLLLLPLLLLYE